MTTQQITGTVTQRFRRCVETGDFDGLGELYTSGAILDVNVPEWRFQRQGPAEIVGQFRDWYATLPRVLSWRETPIADGFVVEAEDRNREGTAEEVYSRFVWIIYTDGERISRQTLYCTGEWDRETVERQRREAPMVEA